MSELTRDAIEEAMAAMMAQGYAPTPMIVHPRTAHNLRLWMRWTHWMAVFDVELLPQWRRVPWWIRRLVWRHRQGLADRHFARLLEHHPWRPR